LPAQDALDELLVVRVVTLLHHALHQIGAQLGERGFALGVLVHVEHELLEVTVLCLHVEAGADGRVVGGRLLENAPLAVASHEARGHLQEARAARCGGELSGVDGSFHVVLEGVG
jgi:hypothetical protein